MSKVIRVDDEVMEELERRAIELRLVFHAPNDVLRAVLLDGARLSERTQDGTLEAAKDQPGLGKDVMGSADPPVQALISSVFKNVPDLDEISFTYAPSARRWVSDPNFVAISIQDSRAKNLAFTVFGRPEEFDGFQGSIVLKPDRARWSRFHFDGGTDIQDLRRIVAQAKKLKDGTKRGRSRRV